MADPFLAQLQQQLGAQSKTAEAQRKANAQRALIDFGSVPDFNTSGLNPVFLQQDVDPLTRQLAEQNTGAGLSTMSRLTQQGEENLRRIPDMLAARGMLRSGELGHQLGEEGLRAKQASYDSTRQLLEYLSGMYSAFSQGATERELQLMQGGQEAAIRQQELAFRQQEQAMAQQAAAQSAASYSDPGGGGDGGQGFLDQLFGSLYPPEEMGAAAPAAGGTPSAWQQKHRNAIAGKAARHRTAAEKQWLAEYNAKFGG